MFVLAYAYYRQLSNHTGSATIPLHTYIPDTQNYDYNQSRNPYNVQGYNPPGLRTSDETLHVLQSPEGLNKPPPSYEGEGRFDPDRKEKDYDL